MQEAALLSNFAGSFLLALADEAIHRERIIVFSALLRAFKNSN